MVNQLYHITFSSPEYKNLGNFLADTSSPVFAYQSKPNTFLKIVGEDGLNNADRIISFFKNFEINNLIKTGVLKQNIIGENNYTYDVTDVFQLPVKLGTILYLEYSVVNSNAWLTEGIEVVSNDEAAFKAAQLAKLEADKGYVQTINPIVGAEMDGTLKTMFPNMTIWIWCRSLSDFVSDKELSGELFDLTPFIIRCSTNMSKNGGNFQLLLPPLVCERNEKDRWVLKPNSIQQSNGEYLAEGNFHKGLDSEQKPERNQFLFKNIISSNDLIFIRHETLETEKEQRYKDNKEFYINPSMLANRIYDMIGLVDNGSEVVIPESNDVAIHISGRDLSKIFIEDGTYFSALESSNGILKVAGDTRIKNTIIGRNYADGGLQFIGLYEMKPIDFILKFIINQLSNIKVVPNELFFSYGDRVNHTFNDIIDDDKFSANASFKPQKKPTVSNGIWQIIKLVIDAGVTNRRLADSSMSTANGSLLNFLRKACQEPFVEMYMDTYGDMYHLIVRKPPFDRKGLITLLEGRVNTEDSTQTIPAAVIDIEAHDVQRETLVMDDSQVYSWYHVFPASANLNSTVNPSTYITPAIFFDEYAQIWGSKPYQLSHNYLPYLAYNDTSNTALQEQAFYDLKYIIESSQYLPFSRKGTLLINRDRRIKIGNLIRYKSTGEIFFVEGVTHNYNISERGIEATTLIQVTRGLVEQLIYGVHVQNENGASEFVSYFNIINTNLNLEYKVIKTPYTEQVKAGTTLVEKPVYSFTNTNPPLSPVNDVLAIPGTFLRPDLIEGKDYLNRYTNEHNKNLFIKFINLINKAGYMVIITSTQRTYQQQWNLKYGVGGDIRNASPGHSNHEFNSAIDIKVKDVRTGNVITKNSSEAEWRSTGVPEIANSLGLKWAGNNDGTFGTVGSPGYYIDRVHFEISNVTQTVEVPVYKDVTKYTTQSMLDTDSVFKNFKVNKTAFNFFLKKLQFSINKRDGNSSQLDENGYLKGVTVTAIKKK